MSETSQQEAAEAASRAKGEAKAAAKDTARAVKAGAEAAAEEIKEEGHKLEGTAQDAAEAARKINLDLVAALAVDAGLGFVGVGTSIFAAHYAVGRFQNIWRTARSVKA